MVLPSGIVSTGWPAVREKSRELGISYDEWQDGTGRAILAKRADGVYAASIGGVVVSIPRQVGKTFLIGGIVFALCLLVPNLTVIWTAHRLRTAGETFRSMQAMARRKRVSPHVARVVLGSGDEAIEFVNGSRILFGARERGFGLGFSQVDVLVLDEAQRLGEATMDDLVPTMNAAPNPLLILTGTPPRPTDSGEVFSMKRREALSGESDDTLYIEFSADRGADPNDRRQWAKANPSYPARTPATSILRMKKNLGDESFLREGLGIWDEESSEDDYLHGWAAAATTDAPSGDLALGLDVSHDLRSAALVVFGGGVVEVVAYRSDAGTGWVPDRVRDLRAKHGISSFGIVAGSPAASLLPRLPADTRALTGGEAMNACAAFAQDINDGRLRHRSQTSLDIAVRKAVRKLSGEGSRWSRKESPVDISPLWAASVAAYLGSVAPPPGDPGVYLI